MWCGSAIVHTDIHVQCVATRWGKYMPNSATQPALLVAALQSGTITYMHACTVDAPYFSVSSELLST